MPLDVVLLDVVLLEVSGWSCWRLDAMAVSNALRDCRLNHKKQTGGKQSGQAHISHGKI